MSRFIDHLNQPYRHVHADLDIGCHWEVKNAELMAFARTCPPGVEVGS